MSDTVCDYFEIRPLFYYFSQYGNMSSRTFSTRHVIFFDFFEIQPGAVMTKVKEEAARERFGVFCRDSSRFTDIMIFSSGTTASCYGRRNRAAPRYLRSHRVYNWSLFYNGFVRCSLAVPIHGSSMRKARLPRLKGLSSVDFPDLPTRKRSR